MNIEIICLAIVNGATLFWLWQLSNRTPDDEALRRELSILRADQQKLQDIVRTQEERILRALNLATRLYARETK